MKFRDTQEAADFIASAASRETSPEIMEAIVFFARSLNEAEAVWDGYWAGVCDLSDIWEHVTSNGQRDASEYFWGAAGNKWWDQLREAGSRTD